jgi:DNA primase
MSLRFFTRTFLEMNLLDLIGADGGTLKKQATTGGGEYAGACFWCGGNDRFRVWVNSGRYWCRGCGKAGDEIQYLRERRGLSFLEACEYLGYDPGPRKDTARIAAKSWTPKEANTPGALWQSQARSFLDEAVKALWSKQGESMRAWLHAEKGLQDATIKGACLGYNPTDIYTPRATWGLDSILKDDGTEKKQWLPAGLVIPLIINGDVLRLRVRRNDPGDGARYVIVSGSSAAPMTLNKDQGAACIVESELDGLLLSQEAGDLCAVIAMGTATAKPDIETHDLLKSMPIILISLDTDEAGANASWKFWPESYGAKAKRWPTVKGKDASDARINGLNLRAWIVAGLFRNEERFERFCIQTIEGGLSDREAIEAMGA